MGYKYTIKIRFNGKADVKTVLVENHGIEHLFFWYSLDKYNTVYIPAATIWEIDVDYRKVANKEYDY